MAKALFFSGFMGSGKSTVAKIVATKLGRRFVDLDQLIVEREARSIKAIFAEQGETYFRAVEAELLKEQLLAQDGPVVALGGGALLSRENRIEVLRLGTVVTLSVSAEEAVRRAKADGDTRPLLSGVDALEKATSLLESRGHVYAEAHGIIDSTQATPEAIAAEAISIYEKDLIVVAAAERSYTVEVGSGIFEQALSSRLGKASRVAVISDSNVAPLYADGVLNILEEAALPASLLVFSAGEEQKHPQTLSELWSQLLEMEADRQSWIVGLGGGVVTDVAGFTAATWMRGISWISASTSLLGMVDAAVGGKTAVDLPGAKNCVGAFWQPSGVICDIDTLKTESDRGYRSGLAEVVKTGLLGDAALFELLESDPKAVLSRDPALVQEMVRRSIQVKAWVVSIDERETGLRAALNLGHTVGHAIEAAAGYGERTHGECVAIGLVYALRIGLGLGVGSEALCQRVEDLLKALQLPTRISLEELESALHLMSYDKKPSGKHLRFVLCPELGRTEFQRIELEEAMKLARAAHLAP